MPADSIVIQRGLPGDQRERAAAIYYAAFGAKYRLLLTRPQGLALFPRLFVAQNAIVALDAGRLVGLAGLHHAGRRFVGWNWSAYRETFGVLGGAWRGFWMQVDVHPHPADELLLEALAVDPAARGQGIGTRLLAAVYAFARDNDYRAVRLGVVDTNPRARALYEREGFVAGRTLHLPGMRFLAGFGATTTMIRPV
jgi:GNAT superfamily N-acetyltransferase